MITNSTSTRSYREFRLHCSKHIIIMLPTMWEAWPNEGFTNTLMIKKNTNSLLFFFLSC